MPVSANDPHPATSTKCRLCGWVGHELSKQAVLGSIPIASPDPFSPICDAYLLEKQRVAPMELMAFCFVARTVTANQ